MRTLDRNGLIGALPILLQKLGELSPSLNAFIAFFIKVMSSYNDNVISRLKVSDHSSCWKRILVFYRRHVILLISLNYSQNKVTIKLVQRDWTSFFKSHDFMIVTPSVFRNDHFVQIWWPEPLLIGSYNVFSKWSERHDVISIFQVTVTLIGVSYQYFYPKCCDHNPCWRGYKALQKSCDLTMMASLVALKLVQT